MGPPVPNAEVCWDMLKGLNPDDESVYTMKASVTTGFEAQAREEVAVKLRSVAYIARGRIYFDVKASDVNKVFELRSVDHVDVVMHVNQNFGFTSDKESCLKQLEQLVQHFTWRKGLGLAQRVLKFSGDSFKSASVPYASVPSTHSDNSTGPTRKPDDAIVVDSVSVNGNVAAPVTVTESVAAPVTVLENVAAPVTVTESVAAPVTVTENIAAPVTVTESVAAPVTVTENVAAPVTVTESVAAPVTVTENVAAYVTVTENVATPVTVTENVAAYVTVTQNVADSVTVTQNVADPVTVNGNFAAPVTITESLAAPITVTENVTASENVTKTATVDESPATTRVHSDHKDPDTVAETSSVKGDCDPVAGLTEPVSCDGDLDRDSDHSGLPSFRVALNPASNVSVVEVQPPVVSTDSETEGVKDVGRGEYEISTRSSGISVTQLGVREPTARNAPGDIINNKTNTDTGNTGSILCESQEVAISFEDHGNAEGDHNNELDQRQSNSNCILPTGIDGDAGVSVHSVVGKAVSLAPSVGVDCNYNNAALKQTIPPAGSTFLDPATDTPRASVGVNAVPVDIDSVPSFRVTCLRSSSASRHAFESGMAARAFGGAVQDQFGWRVKMTDFDMEVMLLIESDSVVVAISLTKQSLFYRNLLKAGPTTLRSTICYNLLAVARPKPWEVVVDPLAGGGSISLEGVQAFPGSFHLCGDNHEEAGPRTAINREYCEKQRRQPNKPSVDNCGARLALDILRWDATRLPLRSATADVIASDLPFGKRLGSHTNNFRMYPLWLQEMARICVPGYGRAVLLTQDKRSMTKALQMSSVRQMWTLRSNKFVNIGGLTACVYLLARTDIIRAIVRPDPPVSESVRSRPDPTVSESVESRPDPPVSEEPASGRDLSVSESGRDLSISASPGSGHDQSGNGSVRPRYNRSANKSQGSGRSWRRPNRRKNQSSPQEISQADSQAGEKNGHNGVRPEEQRMREAGGD